ncbi:hypothetical protein P175DRAFT_0462501 [Aspergillus ochraceoroseus IBT 24754]|uniref:Dienelactone hydrolase domain-containing protein n=3 Tax=Aspergillus subgen. Nidulantes TaxID=2720870 RepID=A0A0F8XEP4_9EURO|nr:uncharacterized protein P175DRAFT_0462501 [Aspergillus ochraceoroseus IBT 24754]KKK22062.1 hypothetical protein ARAM_002405 [Aspergillus rambellii]KKK26002.1 hypothetical protein AOCH_000458 [Aspergillus ochraceoroseus]PTU19528.1 hypothetical protein P175DRAFT_0462501 [Aspergillus ochraceoroseus IBT 24754]
MASNPPKACCTTGVLHTGTPTGKTIKYGAYSGYLAVAPPTQAHQDVALMMMPDIMGIYENSQLLADAFALRGYTCLVVDVFNGDALKLNTIMSGFDVVGWINEGRDNRGPHTTQEVDPIVKAAIQYLKQELGFKKLGAVGYCFGAKYVVRHFQSGINVGFIAHPSWVDEKELAGVTGPLSIAAALNDDVFPPEKRHKSEEILLDAGSPFQINLFSGSDVGHGFAIRGHLTPETRFAYDQAFNQAVDWFDKFLK